jgi:phosphogluconate dehydratase
MYPDVFTVAYGGLRDYGKIPEKEGDRLVWKDLPKESKDELIVRTADHPFSESGGLRLLKGNLGRSVIKISAVPEDRQIIEAPAIVFDAQEELLQAFP